jgi:Lipase (class 3)
MKLSNDPVARKIGTAFLIVFVLRVISVYLTHQVKVVPHAHVIDAPHKEEAVPVVELLPELDDWKQVHQKLVSEDIGAREHPLALATYMAQQIQALENQEGEQSPASKEKTVKTRELKELQHYLELMELAYTPSVLGGKLEQRGYHLLRQEETFYLAYNPQTKNFVVNILEASGFSRALLQPIESFTLPHNPLTGRGMEYTLKAPAPLRNACQKILQQVESILEHLAIPGRYQVVVQGHGMGGGVATLLGLALRAKIPTYRNRIQVVAVAPPAVVQSNVAVASASFVTSILHPNDILPLLSSSLARDTMIQILTKLDGKLQSKGIHDPKWIPKLLTGQQAPPLDASEFRDICSSQQQVHEEHFLIAGRTIYLKEPTIGTDGTHPSLQLFPITKQLFSDHNLPAYVQKLHAAIQSQASNDPSQSWMEAIGTVVGNTLSAFLLVLFFTESLSFLQKNVFMKSKVKSQ